MKSLSLKELKEAIWDSTDNKSLLRFLTNENVCEMFQITRRTLHNWVRKGKFPQPIQVLATFRWDLRDIEAFLRESKGRNPQ